MTIKEVFKKFNINNDIIRNIYQFLSYKKEFNQVVKQINSYGFYNDSVTNNLYTRQCFKPSATLGDIFEFKLIWWPPVKSMGYIIIEKKNIYKYLNDE